jgi:two-component sensor histidine kinase
MTAEQRQVDANSAESPGFLGFSRSLWLLIFAYYSLHGLFMFGYKFMDFVTRDNAIPFGVPLVEEITGTYSGFVLLPLIIVCARRFRLSRRHWLAPLGAQIAGLCVYSFLHTSIIYGSRLAVFAALGWGRYDYGHMRTRYAMEFFGDGIVWTAIVSFVLLFDHYRRARAEELRRAQLEGALVRAELQALRLQIEPHFIFNALNAIATAIFEAPRHAEAMIAALGNLLRRSLSDAQTPEITLADEVALLEDYLAIMRGRFEDRLTVELDIAADCRAMLVPSLILQPLVENCFRHGFSADHANLRIRVTAAARDGRLAIAIADNGAGAPTGLTAGIGLGTLRRRLAALHGAAAALRWDSPAEGGFHVSLLLPLRHHDADPYPAGR